MRIYIAGASAEPERVQRAMDASRKLGLEVTLDWLAAIRAAGAATPSDANVRRACALADLQAIDRADVVWLLAPENASTGAWVELGYAIALRSDRSLLRPLRAVIVSGPGAAKCIFAELADALFASDEAALLHFAQMATESMNYVLCAWSGSRRARDKRTADDPAFFLREHVRSLEQLEHRLDQVTVVVPHNPKEPRAFRRYLTAELPSRIRDAPVVLMERPNVGMSYGSFADAFLRWRLKFDHYFFMEDDYVFTQDRFDALHLDLMRAHPDVGYVAGLIWDARGAMPRHAGMSCGLLRSTALEAVFTANGTIPHAGNNNYGQNELLGQIGASQALIRAGWELMDWRGRYRVLFRDAKNVVQTFHADATETILAPL